MFFQCKNCGGNVVYSPEKKEMFCPFCDSLNSEDVRQSDSADLTICPNCSGEIIIKEYTSATQCPYCDSYLILDERIENSYEPKKIVPFKIGKESCKQSIRKKFKQNIFAPIDFLSEVRLNSMQGYYVPYWLYEYKTHCSYVGEGTKIRTWVSGNTEYTERSYYNISREMDIPFDKIPVDASIDMPDDVMDLMEPYDYQEMTDFTPKYLSGFCAERYNMPSDELEQRARNKMIQSASSMLKESYAGYNSVNTVTENIHVNDQKSDFGLLPVWKYIYEYQNKTYPFYVNGQTGKIIGEAPISKKKVFLYTGTLWACFLAVLIMIPMILSWL